jgi:NAD(P)-dependent dehydrogenase (short-subunit alcohol dehydrogenase family)
MPRLAGRRILITGGASGIGRATCELFAREGAAVAVLDRDAAHVGTGHAIAADVSPPAWHVRCARRPRLLVASMVW